MLRFRIACSAATIMLGVVAAGPAATGSAGAESPNPITVAIVKTFLAGSAAFKARGHVTVPEQATYLGYAIGEVGGGGARAYVAVSERGHGATRAQVRVVFASGGPVFYLHVPQLVDVLPAGKTWVRATVGDLMKLAGVDSATVSHFATALNPSSLLPVLGSITTVPVRVGPVMIAGHLTQRYHASINLGELAAHSGLPADAKAGLSGLRPVSLDAWIDQSDGYLRQLQIAYTAKGSAPPHLVLTIQLHDFGAPVHVAAPSAAATVPLAARRLARPRSNEAHRRGTSLQGFSVRGTGDACIASVVGEQALSMLETGSKALWLLPIEIGERPDAAASLTEDTG